MTMPSFSRITTKPSPSVEPGRVLSILYPEGIAFGAAERKSGGVFVGMVGLQRFRGAGPLGPCVEIGWRLAREHWGMGYATEAARAWLAHGFDALGLPEIVAFTNAGNARSLAVMARLGMRCDPGRDFEHPGVPEGHPLRAHVLYSARRPERTAG